jgi:methyltransferase (TIGR00027 family)
MKTQQPADGPPAAGQPSTGQPSTSALTAAAARAAHLIVDQEPRIFTDPLAAALLGERADELISYHTRHGTHPVLVGARVQAACRSRYTQDVLVRAAAAGVRQYVVLGAGLDSFAYQTGGLAGALRVFEVDHPASQQFKQTALRNAGIDVPAGVRFVPADLAAGSLPLIAALAAAGFDASEPAVVAWLGVTMYLSSEAVAATLAALGGLAPGSEVIADYLLPEGERDDAGSAFATLVARASAEQGEPWQSFFTPAQITALAHGSGFAAVRSVRQRDTVPAALWQRADSLRPSELAVLFHGTVSQR